jgi:hypothetical protein
MARPLLAPLKPRWFLSFYGRSNPDYPGGDFCTQTPDNYPKQGLLQPYFSA